MPALFPVIDGKLSFTLHGDQAQTAQEIKHNSKKFFFSSDCQEAYEPLCLDFGPVDLGVVHEFCSLVAEKWNDPRLAKRELVYYSESDVSLRTNAAFLLAAFLVTRLHKTPEEAWAPFSRIPSCEDGSGIFAAFREASCAGQYGLSIMACLAGLAKAVALGWYDPATFDLAAYRILQDPANGNMSVICPKLVAHPGPSSAAAGLPRECTTRSPAHYARAYRVLGVTCVVRLNDPDSYDAEDFVREGLGHLDLPFGEGEAPSARQVVAFLGEVEAKQGAVAVHCRSGLGRTGCLIGTYLLREHGFTAEECIGWLRIVRPGSVLGAQHDFLHECEEALRRSRWKPLALPQSKAAHTGAEVGKNATRIGVGERAMGAEGDKGTARGGERSERGEGGGEMERGEIGAAVHTKVCGAAPKKSLQRTKSTPPLGASPPGSLAALFGRCRGEAVGSEIHHVRCPWPLADCGATHSSEEHTRGYLRSSCSVLASPFDVAMPLPFIFFRMLTARALRGAWAFDDLICEVDTRGHLKSLCSVSASTFDVSMPLPFIQSSS